MIVLGLGSTSTAFAKKVGCGVRVHEDFKLSRQVVEGKQYKKERTILGNSKQDFLVVLPGQDAAYSIRYGIERFAVQVSVENLKSGEVKTFDLGSIHPRDAVSGVIFSGEFKMEIEPIHFNDESGKPRVMKEISGKCKLQEFYIGDLLPIP